MDDEIVGRQGRDDERADEQRAEDDAGLPARRRRALRLRFVRPRHSDGESTPRPWRLMRAIWLRACSAEIRSNGPPGGPEKRKPRDYAL
jgi:hypothetical protein